MLNIESPNKHRLKQMGLIQSREAQMSRQLNNLETKVQILSKLQKLILQQLKKPLALLISIQILLVLISTMTMTTTKSSAKKPLITNKRIPPG